MDKKKKMATDRLQGKREKMPAVVKNEQSNKGLSLSSKQLYQTIVKPKVKNGKIVLDKNNKDHRYLMEEEY
ncbi:MAG: hypothetical protein PHC92_10600 [Syntrophomonadaceae bacterium]|nr:hypothetical protein [Syntrophomonadaceae bacterium]MDD3024491.1 hypothetical protein [Syntrophomonadaceae bacterium]